MGLFSKIAVTLVVITLVSLILLVARLRKDLDDNAPFVVSTTKICQLTGVEDRERPEKPTGQLLSGVGAGVTGSDLGYPFEHEDRLLFLFGDTREINPDLCEPAVCGTNAAPKILIPGLAIADSLEDWNFRTRSRDGADSMATVPIQSDPRGCLPLKFETDPPTLWEKLFQLGNKFHGLTLDGNILGRFETPISGFSVCQTIYAFFSLRDNGFALGDPQPGGRSVLASSTDQGRTFTLFRPVSTTKFQWPVPVVVDAKLVPGLPSEVTGTGKVLLIFGTGRENSIFRFSYPYLAVASMCAFPMDPRTLPPGCGDIQSRWRYYAGTHPNGTVKWLDRELDAVELPPFGSPRFEFDRKYGPGYHRCIGEFSVQYDSLLNKWLMLYACGDNPQFYNPRNGRGIFLRMADAPWGPWSMPRLVFDPAQGYCHFMHAQDPSGCKPGAPNPADLGVRDNDHPEKNAWGGEYAAFLLPSRYNEYAEGRLTLYFVMSTWNPYQVVQMKTELRRAVWWKRLLTIADERRVWVP